MRQRCCLLLILLLLLVACAVPPGALAATPTAFLPSGPTSTPFQPVGPTAAPTASPSNPYLWHGLDVSAPERTIQVTLQPGADFHQGREVTVTIRPGWPCNYEDHRACISLHQDGRLILATVHSGVGGEGDGLRDALEGTGLNRAGLPLAQVRANLQAVQGTPVRVPGADGDLRVLAAVRVPAGLVDAYYQLPVDDALALLAETNPALDAALRSDRRLLAIETCGWRHPEEPWAAGVTDTTGAVYLIFIG